MYSRVKQQGFTLYIVLVLMAIIATLVLAGGQTLNTEMRISSNDADKKYAFGLAEEALKAGELYALETIHPTEVLANPLITSSLEELIPRADVFFDEMVGSGNYLLRTVIMVYVLLPWSSLEEVALMLIRLLGSEIYLLMVNQLNIY